VACRKPIAQLSNALGVGPDETRSMIEAAFFAKECHHPKLRMGRGRSSLAQGSKTTDRARFCDAAKLGTRTGAIYLDISATGAPTRPERIGTRRSNAHPACANGWRRERPRLGFVQRAAPSKHATAARPVHHAYGIERFRAEKNAAPARLEDLIDKTLDLLQQLTAAWCTTSSTAASTLLIDEGRTPAEAMGHREALVSEFFAGAGRMNGGTSCGAMRSSRSFHSRRGARSSTKTAIFPDAHKDAG